MGHANSKRLAIQEAVVMLCNTSEGISIYEIAAELDCDPSTAHRYLKEIEQTHDLIEMERGKYRLEPDAGLAQVSLHPSEALIIYVGLRRFIRHTSQAPKFMISALRKVSFALQRKDLFEALKPSIDLLEAERPASLEHTQVWQTLIDGWRQKRLLRIRYTKWQGSESVEHLVEPYLFEPMAFGDGVYLIAWDRTRNDLRTFKPERIDKVVMLNETFEQRMELQIDVLLRQAWGIWYGKATTRVILRFSPNVARRLQESTYMTSESKELQADGSLLWSVEVHTWMEMLSWIRGWAAEVEVLEPSDLRAQMKTDLEKALQFYRS